MDSIMLVCAVLASLAVGVLAAYGVCLGFFAAFRMQALRPAATPAETVMGPAAGAVSVAEG